MVQINYLLNKYLLRLFNNEGLAFHYKTAWNLLKINFEDIQMIS